MSTSSPKDELLASLRQYRSLLQQKKDTLERISVTSNQLRTALQGDESSQVDKLLLRRDEMCRNLATICRDKMLSDNRFFDIANQVAARGSGEIGELAKSAVGLHKESEKLGEEILACQHECEDILTAKLKTTSEALQKSVQRRKLDAAYGPACRHTKHTTSPSYLDTQK